MPYWGNRAAGLLIRSENDRHPKDDRYLLLLRSPYVHDPCIWGIPGGRVGDDGSPLKAAKRETEEEIGRWRLRVFAEPIHVWRAPDADFKYLTFLAISVDGELEPELNWENTGYIWVPLDTIRSRKKIEGYGIHPCVAGAAKAYVRGGRQRIRIPGP